jgi:hypothetical protein
VPETIARCAALAHPKICGHAAEYVIITGAKKESASIPFCKVHVAERLLNFVDRYSSVIVARLNV